MLDEDGYSMTEVGYNGDPMRVTLMANTPLENSEVKFTPGSGIASFDKLLFLEPGRFSFIVSLSFVSQPKNENRVFKINVLNTNQLNPNRL